MTTMSTIAVNPRTAPVSMMGVPQLAGFFFAFRICITLLAFQSAPVVGTAVSIAASFLLLFLALLVTKDHAELHLDATMKWLAAYRGTQAWASLDFPHLGEIDVAGRAVRATACRRLTQAN